MKMIDDVIIIGIDSGYGNIKTANCCFPASVSTYAKEPVFKEVKGTRSSLRIRRKIWTTMCWRLQLSRGN